MINSDDIAYSIIFERLQQEKISEIEKDILSSVTLLMSDYSFVDNQTYPRPNHPNIEKRKDAYFTLIAIILSLRTTLENEQKAVDMFMRKYHSIDDVVKSNNEELENIISCAGMPSKKASTILKISNYIKDNYAGNINNINNGNILEVREKLLQLPGVGEKSADCMLELAFNLPSIVIDINVFRVITRIYFEEFDTHFENKKDILKVKKFIEENIIKDYKIYQIVHTIILLHGKYVCKSKPLCLNCKLNNKCKYYLNKVKYKQLSLF